MMKIVFFGNSKYSLIGAKIIHEALGLSLIMTIPQSPLVTFAQEKNIPFLTARILDTKVVEEMAKYKPDFLVVEDYGLILPDELLAVPKYASLNIHHSLLPKYRGPTPVPSTILAGEKVTGVSVIKMSSEVDAGDILAQEKYEMKPHDTTESILTILNEYGGHLLVKVIQNFNDLSQKAQKQDSSPTPYTPHMTRESGLIDLANPPDKEKLDRMVRAYFPWPGVWTRMKMASGKEQIVKFLPEKKIQVEGKNAVSYEEFYNGYPELKETIQKMFS